MRFGLVVLLAMAVAACQSSRSPMAVTQAQGKASAAPVQPSLIQNPTGGGILPVGGAGLIGNDGLGAVDPAGAPLLGNDGAGAVGKDVGAASLGKVDETASGGIQAPSVGQAIRPTAAPLPVVNPAAR